MARALVKASAPLYSRRDAARGTPTRERPHQRLFPLNPVPATPYVEQLSIGPGRRTLAIALALLIAGLLLFMLLHFGFGAPADKSKEQVSVVSLEASEIAKNPDQSSSPKPEPSKDRPALQPPSTATPLPPPPPSPLPSLVTAPQAAPTPPTPAQQPPAPTVPKIGVRPPGGQVYGPPNVGGSPSSGDSQRVGTAPNGEPLYAAAWYREPSDGELRGYLSTADGPGWGLIACRTAPDYKVEDCVGLDEYPNGSQIMRAVLAAAWQFQVRPPRVGGQSLVGAWVRIRIDYGIKRR